MPIVPLREKLFNAACGLAGKMARIVGRTLTQPVFIVGTGRCGTSLLVRILNSHPALIGFPGEANELWHPALEPFETATIDIPPIEINPRRFTEVSLAHWPSEHSHTIQNVFTGFHLIAGATRRFFTKSAMISFMIPNIMEMFSDARIIHIYRYAPSVIESYFKKNFGKYSRFHYSERDYRMYCARYWNDCILEISKQQQALSLAASGQYLEFSYEDLCRNPNVVLHDLAMLVGVDANGFGFDLATISSQNYKVSNYATDPERAALIELMAGGMELTGYLSGGAKTLLEES